MDDFYDLLEVSEDAPQADIRAAWREKARQYHPDVNDDDRANAQFKTLRTAYDVLSDESKRSAYDRLGHADYVSKRLDGLPTAGMTRPNASPGSGRWQGASSGPSDSASARASDASGASGGSRTRTSPRGRSSTDGRSQSSTRSTRSRASSNRSTSKASGASTSNRSATDRSSASNASSADRASGTASRSSSGQRSSTASASNRAASTRADAGETAGAETTAEATEAGAATRNPLWYGWVATLLASAVYLAGLAVYLGANAGALSSVAAGLATSPRAALLANHGLTLPGTFALDAAAAAPGPALAFPVAAALLAVVFAAVVARFGHGTAYLYLVGALAPLAALAVGPVVSVPAVGATLALVVALPVLGTALFLADAGRFLLAD